MTTEPSRKRPRLDPELTADRTTKTGLAAGTKKDDEFWFEDGNVVLEAGKVAFRVHGSLLSRRSDVFREMLEVPPLQGAPGSGPMKGCRVIQVTDYPDDLRHLFRVLFLGKPFIKTNERIQCSIVVALARLAHRYHIDDVKEESLRRMQSCFNSNSLCVVNTTVKPHKPSHDTWISKAGSGLKSSVMSCVHADGIAALDLARLLPGRETDDMIPSALYMCCQLDINTIVNGVSRADGMVERLRPADIVLCIQARMNMLHENIVIATRVWQPATDPDCTTTATGECLKLLGAASLEYQSFKKSAAAPGVPASLAEWSTSITINACGCCKPCTAMLRDRALKERNAFWKRARDIMGFASIRK